MLFEGTVDSKPARFLIDSGASAVFVSHAYACRLGLELHPCKEEVKLANGSSLRVWGMCCSAATIQEYSGLIEAYVVELSSTYDVILGATWLHEHAAILDYAACQCVVHVGGNRVVLQCEQTSVESAVEREPVVLSARGMARLLRKRDSAVQLLLVRTCGPTPVDEGETDAVSALPQEIQDVVGMFKDVFSITAAPWFTSGSPVASSGPPSAWLCAAVQSFV
jgi:gag-polyprotein putative aspartyl protease